MKDPLESHLDRLRSRTLPEAPANIEQNVMRSIRLNREAPQPDRVFAWFSNLLPAAGFASASVAIAVVASFYLTSAFAETPSPNAREALGFDAFARTSVYDFDQGMFHHN